jgi:predicted transcriptional regulator
MLQLDIEKQASWLHYRVMSMNWTSKLALPLARFFQPAEILPAEFVDRDAERVRHELDLIRIRFPHHG